MAQVQLYCDANKNKSVATRWGRVKFGSDGYAEHEIPEGDLHMVKALRWYISHTHTGLPASSPAPEEVKVVEVASAAPEEAKEEVEEKHEHKHGKRGR